MSDLPEALPTGPVIRRTRPRGRPKKVVDSHVPTVASPPLVPDMPDQIAKAVPAEKIGNAYENVIKPKPPKGERHVLRAAGEYPADDMQGGMHHIEKRDFPQGYDLQWLGISVWGQPLNFVVADFTRKGWEPVYADDFDGKFGYMVPPNWEGPIVVQDLMLVARSMAWSEVARKRQRYEAESQVNVKVGQLRRGELDGVSLNPQHKHIEKTNMINVSLDQVRRPASIPEIED